eukprot:gene2516-3114_t
MGEYHHHTPQLPNIMKIPFELNFDPNEIDSKTESILKNFNNPFLHQQHHHQQSNINNNNNNQKQLQQQQQQKQQLSEQSSPLTSANTTSTTSTNQQQQQSKPREILKKHQRINNLEEKVLVPMRVCEFCGSTTTPTWRRGPSGKGSLCNACGIKWRLKGKDGVFKPQQHPKGQQSQQQAQQHAQQQHHLSLLSAASQQQQHHHHQQQQQNQIQQQLHQLQQKQMQKQQQQQHIQQQNTFQPISIQPQQMSHLHHQQQILQQQQQQQQHHQQLSQQHPSLTGSNGELSVPSQSPDSYRPLKRRKPEFIHTDNSGNPIEFEKGYYCKYCKKTWPQSSFKNSQQFGAHCSNCSRKPRSEVEALISLKKKMSKKRPKDMFDDDGAVPLWDMNRFRSKPFPSFDKSTQSAPLLSRLIHVVENQLIESNELNSIRDDIDIMKSDLINRKKRRMIQLNETKQKINNDTQLMKMNIDKNIKNRERKSKMFIDDLRSQIEMKIHDKEIIYIPDHHSTHTVPITLPLPPINTSSSSPKNIIQTSNYHPTTKENLNKLSPTLSGPSKLIPLSPELIHSPSHFSLPTHSFQYRDEQGNYTSKSTSTTTN